MKSKVRNHPAPTPGAAGLPHQSGSALLGVWPFALPGGWDADFDYRRWFWRLQLAGWSVSCIWSVLVGASLHLGTRDTVLFTLFRLVSGFGLSCALRPWYRRLRQWPVALGLKTALVLGICLVLSTVEAHLTNQFAVAVAGGFTFQKIAGLQSVSILSRGMFFLIWSLLYFGIPFVIQTQRTQMQMLRHEAALRTAEIEALRAQMIPHFLLNAMNVVKAEAEAGNVRAVSQIIQSLANYCRLFLLQQGHFQPLGNELAAVESFMEVASTCFEKRLDYSVTASAAARQIRAPTLLIQPLVENALKYGQSAKGQPLRIQVQVTEGDPLQVDVINSGEWRPREPSYAGIGLPNLRRRLTLLLGPEAELSINPEPGQVRMHLRLPRAHPV